MLQLLFFLLLFFCATTIQGQHLFPWDIDDGWIRYIGAVQWRLLDAVSSTPHSLSVLLSAVVMSRTTWTVLALACWSSSQVICVIFATCTSCGYYWGWRYFTQSFWLCGNYLRVASIQRNTVDVHLIIDKNSFYFVVQWLCGSLQKRSQRSPLLTAWSGGCYTCLSHVYNSSAWPYKVATKGALQRIRTELVTYLFPLM